jgi:hypothetical protein
MIDVSNRHSEPPTVPADYAGKWLAFDHEETRILAARRTFAEAKAAAEEIGEVDPVLVKAPHSQVRFVGQAR